MSGKIEHVWNGSVLTVISDSGASSADLVGPKGDTGPRGPQGPPGVILNEQGEVVVDLAPYATTEYVDSAIANAEPDIDLGGVATKVELTEAVSNVEAEIDEVKNEFEFYATKEEVQQRITYGTEELEPGVSELATGTLYVVYE